MFTLNKIAKISKDVEVYFIFNLYLMLPNKFLKVYSD